VKLLIGRQFFTFNTLLIQETLFYRSTHR